MQKIKKIVLPYLQTKAISLIHKVYLLLCKSSYIKMASTKTKANVQGSGKKPWRQKGTGNARAGSIRSPLWRGGGVIFGPRPSFKKILLNKKEKQLALFFIFIQKNKNFLFFNELDLLQLNLVRTRLMKKLFSVLINFLKTNLLVLSKISKFLFYKLLCYFTNNLILLNNLSIKHILFSQKLIFSKHSYLIIFRFLNEKLL